MPNYKHYLNTAFATAFIALSAVPASAQSPLDVQHSSAEINAANQLLRDGKVDEAIDAYRKVVPDEQHRNELNYNTAVAEYRKGNMDAAEQLFKEAAGTSSSTISADSRYNLGNCQYAKALQVTEHDKPAAIGLLREAIANYRGALRGKPNNPDARANIELAGELIRTLEQEQKQEEEQKKKDQQQKDEQQKDEQQKDEQQKDEQQKDEQQKDEQQKDEQQKDEQQKDEQQKDEQQKDEQQKDEQQKDEQQKDEQQKDEQQKDQQQENKQDQSDQTDPSDQTDLPKQSDHDKSDQQKPQQDKQQPTADQQKSEDEGKPEEQDAKNQPVPAGDLKAASQQDENTKPEGTVGMADPNAKDGLMTREEALKMLQSVRDRDMLRRMHQQQQERSRHVPVDKDW